MKWMGLKILNCGKISQYGCEKAKSGYLKVEIKPDTVVYYRDTDDGEAFWNQVYAGPLTMKFNYSVLKERREALGYTQQEVADAVGANIRRNRSMEIHSRMVIIC